MKVVIIIPCYNETERLDTNSFIAYLSQNTHLHFIFVDDGSTDNTNIIINQIISKFDSLVSLLINETNKGKAESVRLGVIESYKMNPDYVGFLDADLATPIEEIDKNTLDFLKKKSPDAIFVYSTKSAKNLFNLINKYSLLNVVTQSNLMCISEKVLSVLKQIKLKKVFVFSPGEEEFLLNKIR